MLVSITSAAPMVWPHWLVPAPRASTGTFEVAGDLDGDGDVAVARRHEHADRHDLVDRGIGGVAAARRGIEQHLALGLGAQASRQLWRLVANADIGA